MSENTGRVGIDTAGEGDALGGCGVGDGSASTSMVEMLCSSSTFGCRWPSNSGTFLCFWPVRPLPLFLGIQNTCTQRTNMNWNGTQRTSSIAIMCWMFHGRMASR